MKKMFSLALALIMALALCVPALAATDDTTKTIKIENSVKGETYTAYKIFDVTTSGTNYAYTINGDDQFFDEIVKYMTKADPTDATTYTGKGLTLTKTAEKSSKSDDSTDYKWNLTWNDDATNGTAVFNAVDFATELNKVIVAVKDTAGAFEPAANPVVADGKYAEITVEGAGYYFVDSSLGALCALDTADTVTVYEKNSIPTITKWVDEDDDKKANPALGTEEWQKTADADMGQTVNYKLIVQTGSNPQKDIPDGKVTGTGADDDYVIVDTIPAGLSFSGITKIYDEQNGEDAVWTEGKDKDYTVDVSGEIDGTTKVTITLKASKVSTLGEDVRIHIPYTVKVAAQAIVGANGNPNIAVLTYQEQTSQDSATLYTWEFPVLKFTGTDKTPLANATFEVKNADGEVMIFDKVDDVSIPTYAYNSSGKGSVDKITTDDTGKFILSGLDSGIYTLTETEAPAGYNALTEPVKVKIVAAKEADGNLTGEYEVQVYNSQAEKYEIDTDKLVEIENKTGIELPSTGGMGTTIFYIVGGVMVAGAAILLVTKKKLANQE